MWRITYIVRCFTSFFAVLAACSELFAQEVSDSVTIHFRQGCSRLERNWQGNGEALDRISDTLQVRYADSAFVLKHIGVVGGASPEGSIALNKRLSGKRANVLFDYLSAQTALPDSLRTFTYIGRDWRGLLALAERDPGVPWREETLALLRDVAAKCEHGENRADRNLSRLMALRNGEPYRYMYRRLFPELRASRLILTFGKRTHHDPVLFAVSDPERFSAIAFAAPELVRSEISAPLVSAVPPPLCFGKSVLYVRENQSVVRCTAGAECRFGVLPRAENKPRGQLDVCLVEQPAGALVLAHLRRRSLRAQVVRAQG